MPEQNAFHQILGDSVADWRIRRTPEFTEIRGRYCSLQRLDADKHAAALYDNLQADNPGDSWTYLPYGPFENSDAFRAWIQETSRDGQVRLYAIVDNQLCQPVGVSGYLRISPEHGSIEVGHLHFSRYLKKTPAATEAMYLMMRYVFDELGYRRYEWKCNALNQPSINAAKRLGFQFEGIFRQSHVYKNRNRDTAWFSIIDSEWPALKAGFQKWLHPDNFDANGMQIRRLHELLLRYCESA